MCRFPSPGPAVPTHPLPRQRRLASEGSAKPWRCGYSALARFKARHRWRSDRWPESCFQRLVKQFIQMCRRGCRTFLHFFQSEHDFGALFRFCLLSILDVCTGSQRGRQLHVKRGPNVLFITEIYIKEGSLGSEPLGGGVEAVATRKRPGLRPSRESGHARAEWPPCRL
jgi:hypothetical protein